ncbi:DUF2252 domain-containing protein [Deinococcus cellulosilyticus]|uniref:DUF2252 domain-containing protein n=1 Tax=Deinococcus cellulosilyticus (strain DSM 18568 / NBRC 106333 / KACC 11606 / 5516J-15) TaxID=1223518 RepID=A0A511N134_DEIC1|nr:DUF2252 domain-containing protein [Deinococcus cellulosilyticus]GEM46076.1 hypothetical protein DC3_17110 [Deinococcus cellulosilyticus NBRC 106333 = KACC 11606]
MKAHIQLDFQASPEERLRKGQELRGNFDLQALRDFRPDRHNKTALALFQDSDSTRLKKYIPIRYGRMLESAFATFRGGAAVMARDLAHLPRSGVQVQLCGDTHLGNFGLYASPERHMMFDLNDFDETLPGPFEFDLYRLTASCAVAALHLGFAESTARNIVQAALQSYREHTADFAKMGHLEVWYHHIGTTRVMDMLDEARDHMRKSVRKAEDKTSQTAVEKMALWTASGWKFKPDPPKIEPVDNRTLHLSLQHFFSTYLESLPDDRHFLLSKYTFVDAAFRLTGVGSAGRQAYLALMQGQDRKDTLLLQLKQAFPSVLEEALGQSAYSHHGQRVVAGQKLMQANSDIFLGWSTFRNRNFYVRQLRDRKGSIDINDLSAQDLKEYSELCAYVLARAHARSGDAALISGFLMEETAFDEALANFALRYAELNQADHDQLLKAAHAGEIPVEWGI